MKYNRRRKTIMLLITNVFLIAILLACTSLLQQRSSVQASREVEYEPEDKLQESEPTETSSDAILPEMSPAEVMEKDVVQRLTGDQSPVVVHSAEEPEKDELPEYYNLSYFKEENIERYSRYKMENPDFTDEKIVAHVNIGLDNDFYEEVKLIEDVNSITILVNKYNKLPDDFKPELVELDVSLCAEGRGPQHLRPEAARAFMKMHEDAKQKGLNMTAFGTYRSINIQHTIWNNAINSGRTKEDVDSLNSRGGHSEHHTGLAVDVVINNYSVLNTKEYDWYKDRVYEYGFIIRYPEGKEHMTGYKYEPWHLRYVGREIAEDIYHSGLTYEEYYVSVLEPQ